MNNSLKVKFISSLEKCFPDESIDQKPELSNISFLKNERYSFQVAYEESDETIAGKRVAFFSLKTDLSAEIRIKRVDLVPVMMAAYHNNFDENYLRHTPGLYPDVLTPHAESDNLYLVPLQLNAMWVMLIPNEKTKAGQFSLTVVFHDEKGEELSSKTLCGKVIDALLPPQKISVTQWFHADCLASYYKVAPMSDEHFEIIDNYIKTAAEYGINQILTPVLTPPLDTEVGGERPTVQLVDIIKSENSYSFTFEKLDRWIAICQKHQIKTFEISHLFTQWGAEHSPKVMATENGEYKKIFGWETDAFADEYRDFLHAFLKALTNHFKEKGIEKDRIVFHVSDEPSLEHQDNYRKAKAIVCDILKGYKIIDALSNYEFYHNGLVEHPVPAINHMDEFIKNKVPDLWTYYCCGQCVDVSNRFLSMPSARNRIIATQLYKFNIVGFLQWGYNFYYNQFSQHLIDPYRVTDGEYFAPSGDPFSVYPGADQKPVESLRIVVFHEALQDLRAMQLCEQLYSREFVMNLLEGDIEKPIEFKSYPCRADYIITLREKLNDAIEKAAR